jgi:hypothetical protein
MAFGERLHSKINQCLGPPWLGNPERNPKRRLTSWGFAVLTGMTSSSLSDDRGRASPGPCPDGAADLASSWRLATMEPGEDSLQAHAIHALCVKSETAGGALVPTMYYYLFHGTSLEDGSGGT